MAKITADSVRQAFIDAGARAGEADQAAQHTHRFQNIKTYKRADKAAIANTFETIRTNVFQSGQVGIQPVSQNDADLDRANGIMYQAMKNLRMKTKLNYLGKTGLAKLGIDVNNIEFKAIVDVVAAMDRGPVQQLARAEGLNVVKISWDDTARTQNSALGPNITDAYLAVDVPNARTGEAETIEMPIIRAPNFADVTADIDMERFMINVGNASGGALKEISLKEALEKPWTLMSDPDAWPLKDANGENQGVYAPGTDSEALVGAQAAFMPVSKKGGRAAFKPFARNYQSHHSTQHGPQPSVLTLMVSPEGTSMSILGKERDGSGEYGEPLFFNEDGQRAPLTALRPEGGQAASTGGGGQSNASQADRVLVIQVPLNPEHPQRSRGFMPMLASASFSPQSAGNMQNAVISHGPTEGPFDETMGEGWTRATDMPVRVTVQLYKATSDGKVNAEQMAGIKKELDDIYSGADRIGSLVINPNAPSPGPIVPGPFPPMPGPGFPPFMPFGGTGSGTP